MSKARRILTSLLILLTVGTCAYLYRLTQDKTPDLDKSGQMTRELDKAFGPAATQPNKALLPGPTTRLLSEEVVEKFPPARPWRTYPSSLPNDWPASQP